MIRSMTGFGRAEWQMSDKKLILEIKSLNSKGLDLNMRMPTAYRVLEADLRDVIARGIVRGKADITFYVEQNGAGQSSAINVPLVKAYVQQLSTIASDAGVESDVLALAMRMPDAVQGELFDMDKEERREILANAEKAMEDFNNFRLREGAHLAEDLKQRVIVIRELLESVLPFESERIETTRERLKKAIESLKVKFDENRFEQELIYYLEKYDINEEKVRLRGHLDHFLETLENEPAPGRKLGFIGQEMGREINTLGSKANHAEMQRIVVTMKEELEKIKEQVLNVL